MVRGVFSTLRFCLLGVAMVLLLLGALGCDDNSADAGNTDDGGADGDGGAGGSGGDEGDGVVVDTTDPYVCANGTPIDGRAPTIGEVGCQSCGLGYVLTGEAGVGASCVAIDGDGDGVSTALDVDDDGDGLIEIFDAAMLDNIRHNLAGTGYDDEADDDAGNEGSAAGCGGAEGVTACNGYELMAGIELVNVEWRPIGKRGESFTAILEGNGHAISGLSFDGNAPAAGLFAWLGSEEVAATVRNISFTGASVIRSGEPDTSEYCYEADGRRYACAGALAGWAHVNLKNVEVSGRFQNSIDDNNSLGGVVGALHGGSIRDSRVVNILLSSVGASDAETEGHIGGLVGYQNGGDIADAEAFSVILSTNAANTQRLAMGGLVGRQADGSIESASAMGTVFGESAAADNLGGLVGRQSGGSIVSSSATGTISGGNASGDNLGGLVGKGDGGIASSWASGSVSNSGTGGDNLGGLMGAGGGDIVSSWASGSVSDSGAGSDRLGGLVGRSSGSVTASSASGSVSDSGTDNDILGGLVGFLSGGSVTASSASGSVSDSAEGSDNLGGLVGSMASRDIGIVAINLVEATVVSSAASGTVSNGGTGTVTDNLGGFVGRQIQLTSIRDSFSVGRIIDEQTERSNAGGFAGSVYGKVAGTNANIASRISRSYALGEVRSDRDSDVDRVGGFVGEITNGMGSALDSVLTGYWNSETTGDTVVPAMLNNVQAKTTAELTGATNAAPDFFDTDTAITDWVPDTQVWDFGTDDQYPGLRFDGDDSDSTYCIIRPVQDDNTGDGTTTAARFSLTASGDMDEPECATFTAARSADVR